MNTITEAIVYAIMWLAQIIMGGADVSALEYLGLGAICFAAVVVVGYCISRVTK